VKVWQKLNAPRFDNILLKTKTVSAEARKDGILVKFEGEGALKEQVYDLVLQAVGRVPNGKRIGAEAAGVNVNERGFVPVDIQMRTNVPHIFAVGDIVGQPMLEHKAVHEAHVAAEVAAGEQLGDAKLAKTAFDARVIPSVAYTDPEIAWVGITEDEAKARGVRVKKGLFPWTASGRAIANGRDEGFTKLLFDEATHRIVGGGIVGTHAGDMIGEIALAIEMGADAIDIGKTIHPHPTCESIGQQRKPPRQLRTCRQSNAERKDKNRQRRGFCWGLAGSIARGLEGRPGRDHAARPVSDAASSCRSCLPRTSVPGLGNG
jgi:dihydrolipoamide dehydrogenase